MEDTPSSQERAFWREAFGAWEIRSVPTATEAKLLEAIDLTAMKLVCFKSLDAIALTEESDLDSLRWINKNDSVPIGVLVLQGFWGEGRLFACGS